VTMIVALAGTKGGTGKTTLSIALAVAAQQRGRRVLVLDTDRRGDALSWRRVATGEAPAVLGLDGRQLSSPEMLRALAFGYDLTLIDTPSGDPEVLDRVLRGVDLTLIPVGPCPMEVWAVADTLERVRHARSTNPQLRASIIVNRVDGRTSLGRALPQDLARLGIPTLRTRVATRAIHAEAMAHASSACEYDPRSTAAAEILALAEEIETLSSAPSFAARLSH